MDWQCDISCMTDSDDGLENWKNRLYELHGHRCARITNSLRWLTAQPSTLIASEGSTNPPESIMPLPTKLLAPQKVENRDSALKVTIASRWNAHTKYLFSWEACEAAPRLQFMAPLQTMRSRYNRQSWLLDRFEHSSMAWKLVPQIYWDPRGHHTQAPTTETQYKEIGPRRTTMSQDNEVTQARPRWLIKTTTGTTLTVWLWNLSQYAEGNYPDGGPYHDAAVVLIAG